MIQFTVLCRKVYRGADPHASRYHSEVTVHQGGGSAGPVQPEDVPSSRLVIPGQWWAAEQLGLTPVLESEWPDRFLRTYVTASEYFEPILRSLRIPYEPGRWVRAIIDQYGREDLICELAALNHAARSQSLVKQYEEHFLAAWKSSASELVKNALSPQQDGLRPAFLARQCILRALHTVLVPDSDPPTVPEQMTEVVRSIGSVSSAILLVHIIAAELHGPRQSGERPLGGIPESLAMEMSANGLFNESENPNRLIARTWLLWHEYDGSVITPQPRLLPVDMLSEAIDVGLDDVLALGFAYYAVTMAHELGNPIRLDPYAEHPIDDVTVNKFLSRFASTLDELSTALTACPQRWQMGPIQNRPLVRIGDHVVVLDEQYLIERITRGLYWLVHDHERDIHGEKARLRWTQAYGKMIEVRVEDQLRRFAPHILGVGSAFFTEEDLGTAFGTKGRFDKASDVGIDFGEATVLAEIVSAQVTVGTRENADVAAFEKDVERMVIKKARQLDVTAMNLLRDPQPERSPLAVPAKKVFPVIVRGGGFPVNPATRRYIDDCLQKEGLLTYADARIQQLALVDLEELELIEVACKVQGKSLPQVLADWISSSYRTMPLRSYLVTELGSGVTGPPADIQDALGRALTRIASRLGSTWEPTDASSHARNEPRGREQG